MNETIHNNEFVILGQLVLKNGHLYTYKTLKLPPVVLIFRWILLVYVQDLRLFRVPFPLLKLYDYDFVFICHRTIGNF